MLLVYGNAQIDSTNRPGTTTTSSSETSRKTGLNKIDLTNRSNDHLVIQYGFDNWGATPDSATPSGFSRHFNIYFMLDKPFKTNPRLSVGLGVGVGSSNMFFKNRLVDLRSSGARLPFTNVDSSDHFKKFKLTTAYVEAPVELRYTADPLNSSKSFKFAVGAKVGTLINAHTKGKTLQNKSNQTIGDYTQKISSKKYFNSTRLVGTARIGFGIISIHGTYQITTLLKDGAGPEIRPYSIGLTISGL